MLYHPSEIIVFMLFLPVFMNIILPLGMLGGWLMWRGINLLIGQHSPGTESVMSVA